VCGTAAAWLFIEAAISVHRSAAACCLLLLVCLSASIPPYSPTVADA
jgi:hypothetical protein